MLPLALQAVHGVLFSLPYIVRDYRVMEHLEILLEINHRDKNLYASSMQLTEAAVNKFLEHVASPMTDSRTCILCFRFLTETKQTALTFSTPLSNAMRQFLRNANLRNQQSCVADAIRCILNTNIDNESEATNSHIADSLLVFVHTEV